MQHLKNFNFNITFSEILQNSSDFKTVLIFLSMMVANYYNTFQMNIEAKNVSYIIYECENINNFTQNTGFLSIKYKYFRDTFLRQTKLRNRGYTKIRKCLVSRCRQFVLFRNYFLFLNSTKLQTALITQPTDGPRQSFSP